MLNYPYLSETRLFLLNISLHSCVLIRQYLFKAAAVVVRKVSLILAVN